MHFGRYCGPAFSTTAPASIGFTRAEAINTIFACTGGEKNHAANAAALSRASQLGSVAHISARAASPRRSATARRPHKRPCFIYSFTYYYLTVSFLPQSLRQKETVRPKGTRNMVPSAHSTMLVSRRRFGNLSMTVLIAISPSKRARGAPRQK